MLKLVVGGDELQLSTNTSITLIFENPLLSPDRIPIPASLNIDLPPTRTNLAKFGNPDRLASKISVAEHDAHLFFGPIEIFSGKAAFVSYAANSLKILLKAVSLLEVTKTLSDVDFGYLNLGVGDRISLVEWRYSFKTHLLQSLNTPTNIVYPTMVVQNSEKGDKTIINTYDNSQQGYFFTNVYTMYISDGQGSYHEIQIPREMKYLTYPNLKQGYVKYFISRGICIS